MPPSTTNTNQKPLNVFYIWYSELCRRLNSNPAPAVKPAKPKCQTVLDFVGDRLKIDEWNPVISALRHDKSLHVIAIKSRLGNCQFLHEADTEDKCKLIKRRTALLWTAFIMKSLAKSLSCTLRNSPVLSCLELDGLPLYDQYLEPLLKALQKNETLKCLSLSRCNLTDVGCKMVCAYVRLTPNIEILNLSGCGLTSDSGEHLAKLIKYQQINRYCQSWHNSLRYADPNLRIMRGIKRITLNGNPLFGDNGLVCILGELEDDLWIRALDMQKCGITENVSFKILNVVEYSQSLEILDFRLNEDLSISTVEKILSILKRKHLGHQPEFQWCNTTFTLTCDSFLESQSVSTYATSRLNPVHKAKSAPLKPNMSKMSVNPVRRTKTSDTVNKRRDVLGDVQKKVEALNCQLQEEIAKRKETEKVNVELKRKLEEIKSSTSFKAQLQSEENLKSLINAIGSFVPIKNGVHHNNKLNGCHTTNVASSILEKLVGGGAESRTDDDHDSDVESLLNYVQQEQGVNIRNGGTGVGSDSQVSLIKFMDNLKSTNGNSLPKYYIAGKKSVRK